MMIVRLKLLERFFVRRFSSSKPYDDRLGFRVDIAHLRYLVVSLPNVMLVNTQGIYPERKPRGNVYFAVLT